jgi:hypothetical protein
MLPMFMVSGAGPEWPLRVIGPLAATSLTALSVGLLFGSAAAVWPGAILGAGAAVLFVAMVAGYFRRRLVPVLEPAFGHVLLGFVSLGLALVTGLAQLALPGVSFRGWIVYAELTLLGWLVLFITGVWYRLFPFLIWLHFYRGREGSPAPAPATLVHRGTAWLALGLLAGGTALLVVGSARGAVPAARIGAAGVAAGSLLVAAQYVRIFAGR